MPDIDRIIEELLGNRRLSESATFSARSYSDQPLIEKGSDLKARMEQRAQARAARHEREARERRDKARKQGSREHGVSHGQRPSVVSGHRTQQTEPIPFDAPWAVRSRQQERRADQDWGGILQDQVDAQNRDGSPAWQQRENSARSEGSYSSGSHLNSETRPFKRDQWQRIANDAPSLEDLSQRLQGFASGLDQLREFQAQHLSHRRRLPEPIRQMRALEGAGIPSTLAYGSSAASALFYRQAKLMEGYEDDYSYRGFFMQYYPTYATMSDSQLRGYFAWRTKVRAGQMEPAPLSFAFVHAYELLMGVGTTPGEQGLADLRAFGQAYREVDESQGIRLNAYLRMWLIDYAIYHDIPADYQRKAIGEQDTAVLTLFRAEHAFLRQSGRKPRIPHTAAAGTHPTDEQLFQALGAASSYHICTSRLAKHEPELVQAVACDVFRALVMHCSKRRKTDYVEGLFGYAVRVPYTMFSTAVFYEEEPHPDCVVQVSDAESFECKNGRWWHTRACENVSSNSELGLAMHAVDYELRQQLDYAYPLKRREAPKYLWKIVQDTVREHLERRAEAERRKITIDLSKLSGIRAAAAVTQEALLTDEERGEDVVAEAIPVVVETTADSTVEAMEDQTPVAERAFNSMFTPEEAQLLADLLEGVSTAELLGARAQFLSVVVDSINEKLFDVVGDSVIEFDGEEPCIVEDYLEDVREVLHA